MVGVLVHVEREDRHTARDRLRVLGGVLVDEAAVARDISEQDPARATAKRVSHRPEFGAPAIERAEVARQDLAHGLRRLAIPAHAGEVKLVQQRGVERDQLLALQPVQDVPGRLLEIERLELLGDGVQAPQRPAVVVLVMALDQLHRKVGKRPGTALDRLQLVAHVCLLNLI